MFLGSSDHGSRRSPSFPSHRHRSLRNWSEFGVNICGALMLTRNKPKNLKPACFLHPGPEKEAPKRSFLGWQSPVMMEGGLLCKSHGEEEGEPDFELLCGQRFGPRLGRTSVAGASNRSSPTIARDVIAKSVASCHPFVGVLHNMS